MAASQFGCFTVDEPDPDVFLSEVGPDGLPSRKRKIHAKSRHGCTNCKERKVKCDEQQPCGHCVKRKDKCSLLSHALPLREAKATRSLIAKTNHAELLPHQILAVQNSLPPQQLSPLNLQHLKLLHQFENHTYETFIFEPLQWREIVLSLALEHPFVMHSVLLVSASHLRHLHPQDTSYRSMELEHLSKALPGLRFALDFPATCHPLSGDAAMACSILLLQHLWDSSIPPSNSGSDSDEWDSILGLYNGLRNIVFSFWELTNGGSRFTPWMIYSPRLSIELYLQGQVLPPHIEACFEHCLSCTDISADLEAGMDDCINAAQRLKTIWHALSMGFPALEVSSIYLDVGRYLFTWPNLGPTGFGSLIGNRDCRYQAILLFYFAGIIKFRSERFWWMRRRAVYMFDSISRNLNEKCSVCTCLAKALIEEGEDKCQEGM